MATVVVTPARSRLGVRNSGLSRGSFRLHDIVGKVASPTGGVVEQGAGVRGERDDSSGVDVHVFGGVASAHNRITSRTLRRRLLGTYLLTSLAPRWRPAVPVPLSARSLAVLDEARRLGSDGLVFPSPTGRPLSDNTLSKALRTAQIPATIHGMRASLRDWLVAEGVAYELAEAVLGHQPSGIAKSYRRMARPRHRRASQLRGRRQPRPAHRGDRMLIHRRRASPGRDTL